MIWLVVATASAIVLGIFLWLALSEPPRKYRVDVDNGMHIEVDQWWVDKAREARERMWNEEKRAELEELLKKAMKMSGEEP